MTSWVHQGSCVGHGVDLTVWIDGVLNFPDVLTLNDSLDVGFPWIDFLSQRTHTEDHFQDHHVCHVGTEVPHDVQRHHLQRVNLRTIRHPELYSVVVMNGLRSLLGDLRNLVHYSTGF
ncbi:hypothetical protein D3C86_1618140 [compost metagenome]